jgi:hypothetical protein
MYTFRTAKSVAFSTILLSDLYLQAATFFPVLFPLQSGGAERSSFQQVLVCQVLWTDPPNAMMVKKNK